MKKILLVALLFALELNSQQNTFIKVYEDQTVRVSDMIVDNDNNIILLAPGIFLKKLDVGGDTLWTIINNFAFHMESNSVLIDNGGYIVTGWESYSSQLTAKGIFLSKFNNNGELLWYKRVGGLQTGLNHQSFASVINTDKNIYLVGEGSSNNGFSGILLAYNNNGDSIFFKYYDNGEWSSSSFNSIVDDGNNLFILGNFISAQSQTRGVLIKADYLGEFTFNNQIGTDSVYNYAENLIQLSTTEMVYVLHRIDYSLRKINTFLIKINSNGEILFDKFLSSFYYGSPTIDFPFPTPIITASLDGGIILASVKDYKIIELTRYSNSGEIIGIKKLNDPTGDTIEVSKIMQVSDGGILITGLTGNQFATSNLFLIKTDTLDFITDVKFEEEIVPVFYLGQNYPNPFNPSTIISYAIEEDGLVSLKIFDILGREIKTLVNYQQSAGLYSIQFNSDNLPSGIYIYRLQSGNFSQTMKMLLLK